MIIIFASVNKHSYTITADTLMWALLSRSTSTFYFSIKPFYTQKMWLKCGIIIKKTVNGHPSFSIIISLFQDYTSFSKTLATSLSVVTQFLEGLAPFWGSSNYGCNSGIEF